MSDQSHTLRTVRMCVPARCEAVSASWKASRTVGVGGRAYKRKSKIWRAMRKVKHGLRRQKVAEQTNGRRTTVKQVEPEVMFVRVCLELTLVGEAAESEAEETEVVATRKSSCCCCWRWQRSRCCCCCRTTNASRIRTSVDLETRTHCTRSDKLRSRSNRSCKRIRSSIRSDKRSNEAAKP
jgi:hypothetical protein